MLKKTNLMDECRHLSPVFVTFFESLVFQFWLVIFFALGCSMCYEQALKKHKEEYHLLHDRLIELTQEKQRALILQSNLILQVNSQSDPAWIEMALIKGLGLVPEGHVKVLFAEDKNIH